MSLPYYKRFPRDFFEGTIGMSFEVKCAYGLVLDMIYMRDGKLPDDARYIAGMLGCSVRKWNSILSELTEAGKLHCENGIISNLRADYLVEERRTYRDKKAENRSRPNKNSDVEKRARSSARVKPESEPEVSTTDVVDNAGELETAFDAYVNVSKRLERDHGSKVWPVGISFTKERKARLKARIREHGLDAWGTVLRKAAASPHCTGANGWAADFDFLTSKSGFLKTLEGNYDDRTASQTGSNSSDGNGSVHARRNGGKLSAFERLDRKLEEASAQQEPRFNDERAGGEGYTIDAEATRLAG